MNNIAQQAVFQITPEPLLGDRNEMLQKTLRDQPYEFSIEQEYPIVLIDHREFSHSLIHDNQILCHANLWPREYKSSSGQSFNVGLIGNVATHPDFQKQGLMHLLFDKLHDEAEKQGMSHLILWSDLLSFYQKLGFQSLSQESRFFLKPFNKRSPKPKVGNFSLVDGGFTDKSKYKELLSLRQPGPTLARGAAEFHRLLQIPFCHLFVEESDRGIESYCIVGKGADMVGVIHEWGSKSPENLTSLIENIFTFTEWPEMILLSPSYLDESHTKVLEDLSQAKEKHPMALCKPLGGVENFDKDFFIWGLDSI